jgi:hypothetical protein
MTFLPILLKPLLILSLSSRGFLFLVMPEVSQVLHFTTSARKCDTRLGRNLAHVCCTSWFQRSAVNCIIMKTLPLLERISCPLVIIFGIPIQHFGFIIDTDFFTVSLNDAFWVVQEIIGINHSDRDLAILQCLILASTSRPDLILLAKEIENPTQLSVASLGRHEIVESRDRIKWGNRATPVRRNAVTRVTDQEREMELLQDLCGYNSWIVRLSCCIIWIWSHVFTVGRPVGGDIRNCISKTVRNPVGPNSFLHSLPAERGSNSCWLPLGRHKVMRYVLDKKAFSLYDLSSRFIELRKKNCVGWLSVVPRGWWLAHLGRG